jgi:hypothetical protein
VPICGIYDVSGQATTGIELAAMTQALAVFGLEGAQVWARRSVTLRTDSHEEGDPFPFVGRIIALRVEMMFNPELPVDVQAGLTSLCKTHHADL